MSPRIGVWSVRRGWDEKYQIGPERTRQMLSDLTAVKDGLHLPYALTAKGAATQREAMPKYDTCANNPARQTHTTGFGHRSSRLAYRTLYFHAISAPCGPPGRRGTIYL
jgi:hypothetical protein